MTDPPMNGQDDPYRHTHELRTGLTGIKAHAQLLLRHLRRDGSIDPDRLRRRAESIDRLTGRMTVAIARVEDYVRHTGRSPNQRRQDGE